VQHLHSGCCGTYERRAGRRQLSRPLFCIFIACGSLHAISLLSSHSGILNLLLGMVWWGSGHHTWRAPVAASIVHRLSCATSHLPPHPIFCHDHAWGQGFVGLPQPRHLPPSVGMPPTTTSFHSYHSPPMCLMLDRHSLTLFCPLPFPAIILQHLCLCSAFPTKKEANHYLLAFYARRWPRRSNRCVPHLWLGT